MKIKKTRTMKNLSKFLKEKPIAFLSLETNLGVVSIWKYNSIKYIKHFVESFNYTAHASYLNASLL